MNDTAGNIMDGDKAASHQSVEPQDSGLRIIRDQKHPLGPKRNGNELLLAVTSDRISRLDSPEAKRTVYDARFEFGFNNAGIEKFEGPIPLDIKGNVTDSSRKKGEDYAGFAVVFRLTLMPV